MKLFHSPTSPYVRKVMVVLHLTGQADEVELVDGSGTPLTPNSATVEVNPLGKVPCLIGDDGIAYADSRVVTRYLDARKSAGLYPEGDALFPVLRREALADGIVDAAILAVYELRLRPDDKQFQPWVTSQLGKVGRTLGVLEAEVDELSGAVRADHVAVACALGYIDFRFDILGWRATRPRLAAWYEDFSQLEAMKATRPAA